MRKLIIILALLVLAVQVSSAWVLVDQVPISDGDVVKVVQSYNNTTATFKIYVQSISEENLLTLRITKNDNYVASPILTVGDCYTLGKLKIKYVTISGIDFLKIYGQPNVRYNVTKISSEGGRSYENNVNVTIVPYPLIAGKKFILIVEGVSRGKVIMIDPNGWAFAKKFVDEDIITGELPNDVSNNIVLKVIDSRGRTVLTKVLSVRLSYYERVSATIVPQKPMRGGGMVVMLSEPISGTAMLIDSYTGFYNTSTVTNGITTFRIPQDFGGPLILRITDNAGRTVYQTIIELSGEASAPSAGNLKIYLSTTSTIVGQPITVTVKYGSKLVNAKVVVEDEFGDVVNTYDATNGKVTITFSDEGSYVVYAKRGRMVSNKVKVTVKPKPLTITVLTPNPQPNKPVTLQITKGATYVIMGPGLTTPIEGTSSGTVTFTPPQAGTYTVKATYNGQEKSTTIIVRKTYIIEANPNPSWLGSTIEVSITDSDGVPASGSITVRYPNGNTKTFFLNDGRVSIPVGKSGEYVIMFQGQSKSVYVRQSGGAPIPIISVAVLLFFVIVGIVYYKKREPYDELAQSPFSIRDASGHKKAYEEASDELPPNSVDLEEVGGEE